MRLTQCMEFASDYPDINKGSDIDEKRLEKILFFFNVMEKSSCLLKLGSGFIGLIILLF